MVPLMRLMNCVLANCMVQVMEKVGVYKEFSGPVSTQWLAKLGSSS